MYSESDQILRYATAKSKSRYVFEVRDVPRLLFAKITIIILAEMCSTEETIKQFNEIVEIFSNCVDGKILGEIREHKKYCVQSIKNKAKASAQVSEIDSPLLKENAFVCLPQSNRRSA